MAKVVKFVPTNEETTWGNSLNLLNNDTHATSGERTLCGVQLDGDDGIKPLFFDCHVTCEICIGIIKDVKKLRRWQKPND